MKYIVSAALMVFALPAFAGGPKCAPGYCYVFEDGQLTCGPCGTHAKCSGKKGLVNLRDKVRLNELRTKLPQT